MDPSRGRKRARDEDDVPQPGINHGFTFTPPTEPAPELQPYRIYVGEMREVVSNGENALPEIISIFRGMSRYPHYGAMFESLVARADAVVGPNRHLMTSVELMSQETGSSVVLPLTVGGPAIVARPQVEQFFANIEAIASTNPHVFVVVTALVKIR